MHNLNYCRQICSQFKEMLDIPSIDKNARERLCSVLAIQEGAMKFLLPDGGLVIDDMEMRALTDEVDLKLPFKSVALEYYIPGCESEAGKVAVNKRVILAVDAGELVVLQAVFNYSHNGLWVPLPAVALRKDSLTKIRGGFSAQIIQLNAETYHSVGADDYNDEVTVLLGFLNALACSNVHVERSNERKSSRKVKSALPFDSYWTLQVGGNVRASSGHGTASHRSPREHLRRGHIRNLIDKRRIWVNATVVAAGRGSGVIAKDYALM